MFAAPIANADDPLGPIRSTVNGDRSATGCPAFVYSKVLEDLAQTAVRPGDPRGGDLSGYNGKARLTTGWGDPQAAAINDAYKKGAGALISNCDYTEFGVGFHRNDSLEYDAVSIVFGVPAQAAAPPVPTPAADPSLTPTPASRQCPAGSPTPTVPAFGICAPPTDKVSVSFVKGVSWTVNVTNASNIAGKCTYMANGLGGSLGNRSFDIAANGSASFQVPAPLLFVTYHVVTSCHGTFDGKDVEFGHNEQDVTL
ncbi:hypothetical protein BH09ACT8_BH09ACT8_50120 [soil metagenome]